MSRARLLFAAAMLAILVLAAALRLPRLAQRPMHADEANQAVKAGRLYETGKYEYDTTDHHGPSLYWLTLPSLAISRAKDLAGSREADYRIVPVIFGLGLIPLMLLLADGLGRTAVAAAALLTAISPALVFYSRYYIQETLLVFFTLAALGCGWRYLRTHGMAWILAAGAAVGMMHATKETWILSATAAVAAAGLTWGWSRLYDAGLPCPPAESRGEGSSGTRTRLCLHILAGVLTACLVAAAFFSLFGRNWEGSWKSISAYANYFHRGSQPGEHSEPWHYYLQLLFAYRPSKKIFWSEGFIAVLALVGAAASLICRESPQGSEEDLSPATHYPSRFRFLTSFASSLPTAHCPPPAAFALLRFLTFYTFFLTLLYSLISYKTPWCALSFLMGMILLAGVGAAAIFRLLPSWPLKLIAAIVLAAGAGHLGWQAYQLNFNPRFIADPLNPYVYAHTPTPLPRLAAQLDRLAERVPEGRDMLIQIVVTDNYWPLPWYLRKFNDARVGYWLDAKAWRRDMDHLPSPAILILSNDVDCNDLKTRLEGYGDPFNWSLRPGVLIAVYVRKDLWRAYLECIADFIPPAARFRSPDFRSLPPNRPTALPLEIWHHCRSGNGRDRSRAV
ncbi:MAG: flippase activity-associated protein Agl23 [Thermoguttaceae bacterium]